MSVADSPHTFIAQDVSLHALAVQEPAPCFRVPIYQRLYVWEFEQVETLLNDLYQAFELDPGKPYHLGSVLVQERTDEAGDAVMELVDGQQRFTTLFLICATQALAATPLRTFLRDATGRRRLHFAIRETANAYLERLAESEAHSNSSADAPEELSQVRGAVETINAFLQRTPAEEHAGFGEFIYQQARFVVIQAPPHTDLNLLFETFNNRGVQLQHHEVLKARMLALLSEETRGAYATLWDACAELESYVEDALGKLCPHLDLVKLYAPHDAPEAARTDEEPLACGKTVLQALHVSGAGREEFPSLGEILDPARSATDDGGSSSIKIEADSAKTPRSTVSFSVLLQHTLRLWLFQKGAGDLERISDRQLMEVFQEHFFGLLARYAAEGNPAEEFLQLLWEVRYLYDKHVIKSVGEGDDRIHAIRPLKIDQQPSEEGGRPLTRGSTEGRVRRGLGMLQSMLFFTQERSTQYWLTPFLHHLRTTKADAAARYAWLRAAEGVLFCTAEKGSLLERTYRLLSAPPDSPGAYELSELREASGTGMARYWFYKLDFILWYQGSKWLPQKASGWAAKWRAFRFTSRNSVEHIIPQTTNDYGTQREVPPAVLHGFGNLGLLSVGQNSEYRNYSVEGKALMFSERAAKKLDSLKLAIVYGDPDSWDAVNHGAEMIRAFEEYGSEDHLAQVQSLPDELREDAALEEEEEVS